MIVNVRAYKFPAGTVKPDVPIVMLQYEPRMLALLTPGTVVSTCAWEGSPQ